MLAFAAAPLRAETTIYVGKHFEVRDHDAPVKYVFHGQTRVARITGSLSANERIQRLRLRPGWNLISLAVTAPDFLGQLREFMSGSAPAIKALYRWQSATRDYAAIASGESVAAGTVLWVLAQRDAVVALRGGYVEPSQWGAPGGETFVATPALEAQSLTVPAGVTLWRYGARNRRWQAGLTGALASLSDLPSTLPPGEAIYVHSNEPTDLGAPPPEERIRYYHQDHLGSSSVMTDANGALVEETAFYPFGIPRHEHLLRRRIEESYKFTQKERDLESGLHYFEARYLAGTLSRFIKADPRFAQPDLLSSEALTSFCSNPQKINLYAYALGNPLKYWDPSGLEEESPDKDEKSSSGVEIADKFASRMGLIADLQKLTGPGVFFNTVGLSIKTGQFIDDPSFETGAVLVYEGTKMVLTGVPLTRPVGLILQGLDVGGIGPGSWMDNQIAERKESARKWNALIKAQNEIAAGYREIAREYETMTRNVKAETAQLRVDIQKMREEIRQKDELIRQGQELLRKHKKR